MHSQQKVEGVGNVCTVVAAVVVADGAVDVVEDDVDSATDVGEEVTHKNGVQVGLNDCIQGRAVSSASLPASGLVANLSRPD